MHKHLLIITLALLTGIAANAQSVSKSVATSKAVTFLQLKSDTQLQLLNSPYENMYLFSIDGGGFVIVSADNRVQPILGYSLQSNFDVDNIPSNLAAWLEGYDKQIRAAMEDASLPVHAGWQQQAMPKSGVDGFDSIIGPLMTTTWNQSPFYNDLCPQIEGERTVTGCVATAMAQIMKYWNWPDIGVGQHSYNDYLTGVQSADFSTTHYDWTNMPDSLTSSSTSAQVDAVATLMYHCGVAVDMMYNLLDSNGSGAYDLMGSQGLDFPCAENALRTYFKYSPSLAGLQRRDFTNEEWTAAIKDEIDHRRPILYGGMSTALGFGHEFVCDGYDTNGYFHFNWGWSGYCDGYFALNDLGPGFYSFNSSQTAIVGIEPDTLFGSTATCTVTAVSADTNWGTVSGGGTYTYRDTVTLRATPASGRRFLRWSNGSSANPYPLLAHDDSLTAYFSGAYFEDGDILSYTGTNTNDSGPFSCNSTDRIGIKLPASVMPGHNYLSAIDFYHYSGQFVLYVHHGGDDAPGPVVYTQPFEIPYGNLQWYRAELETPMPIDTNNHLWLTVRNLSGTTLRGAKNIAAPDGNWISLDDGNTWQHLNEIPVSSSWDDTSICWFIRCITTHDSAVSPIPPTAFLAAPENGNVGDTLQMELIHSTASSAEWQFGDASYTQTANDTAYMVWDTAGYHTVQATVTNPYGTVEIDHTIPIADCTIPINTFPYELSFSEEDELQRICWNILNYGDNALRIYEDNSFNAILGSNANVWYVSPLLDLSGDQNIWLQLYHTTPEEFNVTVEISQGGTDTSDFVPIYTLRPSEDGTITSPINLSEHYQGNPVRLAVHMLNPGGLFGRFEISSLRIWRSTEGIDEVGTTTLSVHPNPARQTVSVTLPDPEGTLTLFDATGRQLMQRHTSSSQTTVNVSTLPQGVYIMQFTSPRGTTTVKLKIEN